VYSSMWSEAEALSEYGVVPEYFVIQASAGESVHCACPANALSSLHRA
jgi:hypothetical protein